MNVKSVASQNFRGSILSTSLTCGAIAAGLQGASNAAHYAKNKDYYATNELKNSFKKASAKSIATSAVLSAVTCALINGAIALFNSRKK